MPQNNSCASTRSSRKDNAIRSTYLIFPKCQAELFKTILDEEGLRFDREGRPRTAYNGILFTQRMMDSPEPPKVFTDFWTLAYPSDGIGDRLLTSAER